MCGIVGVINKYTYGVSADHWRNFGHMLACDTIRGEDSTGLFGITKQGNINILKAACPGTEFVNRDEFKKLKETAIQHWNAIIGHNRAATKGSVKPENAHPFREGNVVLVQNGTDYSHDSTKSEHEVDTHALCAKISQYGHWQALEKINGPYALVWYDKDTKRLYFTRNQGRPLFLAETDSAWYLSSEHGLPLWLLSRDQNYSSVVRNMYNVTPESLYFFEMDDKRRDKWTEEKKPDKKTMVSIPEEDDDKVQLPALLESKPRLRLHADGHITQSDHERFDATSVKQAAAIGHKLRAEIAHALNPKNKDAIDGSYVDRWGDYERGQKYLFKPYDYQDSLTEEGGCYILFDLVTIQGKAKSEVVGRVYTTKDKLEKYLPKDRNAEPKYFVGTILNIYMPVKGHNKILVISPEGTDAPKEVQVSKSKNDFFTSEDWFDSRTVICPTCQHILEFKEFEDSYVQFENGKMKVYCKDHNPAFQQKATGTLNA